MKRIFNIAGLLVALLAGSATTAHAQTAQAFVNSRIAFHMDGVPDLATANGLTMRAYTDTSTTGTPLTGLTCSAATAGGFDCIVAMPALVPGPHTLTLTAAIGAAESAKSTALSFVEIIITLTNVRVQ